MSTKVLYNSKNKSEDIEILVSVDRGNLVIEGHDLSADLPKLFGPDITEYEWAYTIKKKDFKNLRKNLNSKDSDNILNIFVKRFSGDDALGIGSFLEENNIPFETWNRMGD